MIVAVTRKIGRLQAFGLGLILLTMGGAAASASHNSVHAARNTLTVGRICLPGQYGERERPELPAKRQSRETQVAHAPRTDPMIALRRAIGSLYLAQGSSAADKERSALRARELLKRSRQASGIEDAAAGIQTLAFSAKSRRFVKYYSVQSPTKVVEKERTLSGKIEAEFWMPDKFRVKTKNETMTGFNVSYTEILNGEQAWRDPPMTVRSFGQDRRVIDVDDVERTMLMQTRTAKQQIALYTLGWLLQTPSSFQAEYSYAGSYDLDGQPCDAIVVDGQEGFRTVILLDQKTKLLAALAFGFFDSTRETVIVEVASVDRRFIRNTYLRAREERQARTRPPAKHEVIWRFSDHSSIGGVVLPHKVKVTFDGKQIEELTINEYKVNQLLNPKRFEGKPEVKY